MAEAGYPVHIQLHRRGQSGWNDWVNEVAPTIYLIGGCNGAGKTTFAREFLTTELKNLRFLNPDEIARGLSPLDPSLGLFRAGRVLMDQIKHYVAARETFTIESTLSGRTYVNILREALAQGYEIEIHYLLLPDVEIAIRRVAARVRMGGHNVPEEDVRRRFARSRTNLILSYFPLANRWPSGMHRFGRLWNWQIGEIMISIL